MKKNILIFPLMFLISVRGFTAGERTPVGGRSLSMGGTSVTMCDLWSLGNNQAGTAWVKGVCAGLSFENRFLLKELRYEMIGLTLPVKTGTFGLFLNRYGNDQCSQLKAGLSYARKFGKHFSVGIQINVQRIHVIDGYGNKNLASGEIGLLYHADQHLSIGVQIVNPVPARITKTPMEPLPSVICIGLGYRFSDDLLTTMEVEKDLENPVMLRAGVEYHIARSAWVRFGIATGPMAFSFGFGLKFGKITVDMVSGYHQALGFSPSGSIIYSFK